ncbi:MAG: exo-alpha-sialidase [Candidatus Dormibacteraeota bacterium]|nr:exo-alpha-sialidase [Candidatus Dormibacteraeota bacterium]MBV9524995.1 exo-alpha-sialidase [Candidatus Dormibacteraeota bacterium]
MRRTSAAAVASTITLAALATFAGGVRAYAPGNPTVVSDVSSSADHYDATLPAPVQPNTQIEPSIAVNPGDPKDVVTAFQVGRVDAGGDADNGFATSLDSGVTWRSGNLPGATKLAPDCPNSALAGCALDRASDAVVAFGKDPTGKAHGGYFVYVNSLVFDDTSQNALPSGMALNVSSDGGLTWTDATVIEQDNLAGLNDKNWIVADNGTGTGHHPGRLYMVWDRVVPVVYAYCDPDSTASVTVGTGCDKLGNWSTANGNGFYVLFPGQGIGTMPVVLNNGDLGLIFNSETSNPCTAPQPPTDQPTCTTTVGVTQRIEWAAIPGAGSTVWPAPFPATTFAPVTIATYMSNGVQYQRAGSLPQVAYDPTTGDAFVGWEDNRYRTDATPSSSNQNDAVIAVSSPAVAGTDPGLTWSAPIRVNQDATNDHVDHWNTMLAVGADGILRVGYRQRYEPDGMSPTASGIDTYYQESRDQGQTFTTPLKVNTAVSSDPQFGAFSRNGLFLGDYQQLAAAGADETFVTRDESFAPSPGASCNTGPFTTIPPAPCQNQETFVAHLVPSLTTATPESRFVPALLVVAGVAGYGVYRRRRRLPPRSGS